MDEPRRQKKIPRAFTGIAFRIYFLAIFMLGLLTALTAKLWHEQVTNSQKWRDRLRKSSSVTVRIPSVRGEIRDRNGVILVANRPSYCVDFYLPQMVAGYREMNGGKAPMARFQAKRDEMLKDVETEDIVQIVNDSVIPKLEDLNVARNYNAGELERHFRTNEQVAYNYLEDTNFDIVAKVSENDVGLPGVDVSVRPVRQYLYGALAAHVLGYVGAPKDINKLSDIKQFTYYQPEVHGRSNVEEAYDVWLRGKPGRRVLERTAKNKIGAEISREDPTPGDNVWLTIDARIQTIVEQTLQQAGVGRAAIVVADPRNGDILAMASVPNYDPNVFIPKISQEDMARLDEDVTDPLVNRAIQPFAPGSTYKTVSALAGMYAGLNPSHTYFNCAGGVTVGNKFMKCWIHEHGGAHGSLNLVGAIKNSCNAYFYQWGRAAFIGENRTLGDLDRVGEALGLGVKSGLPLSGDSPGILPGPKWLAAHGQSALEKSWGHIANTCIGQGSVLASPLQMAMVAATLANGGTSYYPRLVSRVLDPDGKDVRDADGNLVVPVEPKVRANLHQMGLSAASVEVVRQGMWKVVNEAGGTGKNARIKGVEVAGKTGTAQFWRQQGRERIKDNHVWFICFAPYKEPKFAVCVMIQGAKSGGGVAAPVAQKILSESLALDAGYDPGIAWTSPIRGSLTQISEIVLKDDGGIGTLVATTFQGTDQKPGERSAGVDDETADHTETPDRPTPSRARDVERPDVRASADVRGRITGGDKKPGFWQRILAPGNLKPATPATAPSTRH